MCFVAEVAKRVGIAVAIGLGVVGIIAVSVVLASKLDSAAVMPM